MELTVIGCDGAYPGANGACSGYLVRSRSGGSVLLDCGSGVLSKLMALMDPALLDAIVITHWHNDHASDLLVLRYYLLIHQKKLTIYAPLDDSPLLQLCRGEEFDIKDIAQVNVIGSMAVSVQSVAHSVPAYAVRLTENGKSLVYTRDTDRWKNLTDFCRQADLLICDASFSTDQWHEKLPHLSAQQAAMLAREAQVKGLMITHCPPTGDRHSLLREARAVFADSVSAAPGLRLAL